MTFLWNVERSGSGSCHVNKVSIVVTMDDPSQRYLVPMVYLRSAWGENFKILRPIRELFKIWHADSHVNDSDWLHMSLWYGCQILKGLQIGCQLLKFLGGEFLGSFSVLVFLDCNHEMLSRGCRIDWLGSLISPLGLSTVLSLGVFIFSFFQFSVASATPRFLWVVSCHFQSP